MPSHVSCFGLMLVMATACAAQPPAEVRAPNFGALRQAIDDLALTYPDRYADAERFRKTLGEAETQWKAAPTAAVAARFTQLQREALLANPLLKDARILLVRRAAKADRDLGMPTNHECNSSLQRDGYNNEIAILSLADGRFTTLYRPKHDGYVGEVDLYWDAGRLLFTQSNAANWSIHEIGLDGGGLRQVSKMPDDVDSGDACYLPNGKIIFGSTASYQSVPCWHGQKRVSNLYLMNADGSGTRQLCFDQDHDLHPTVLNDGQVMYSRWDYTGINHIFMRQLMVMQPDGRGQKAVYGSNSWFPNALYFPRQLPGTSGQYVCILSGYHGPNRMGQLVIVDARRGWHEAEGLIKRISGRGDPIRPIVRDQLVQDDWPKFLHPWPISDKHFLVSAKLTQRGTWGLYLADVFDNVVLLKEEPGTALLEPMLITRRKTPPALPEMVDLERDDAMVYVHDVHAGPGMAGVPPGTVKQLRVLSYHFAPRNLGGPDRIGIGGPWEVMRIHGTVPVESDGSASFTVPANTPIAIQPLDSEGKAVALMRSWMTAMPGEVVSCVGCHERPADAGAAVVRQAALRKPRPLEPWYGPARGFDFEREVQPVLNAHCIGCHDGKTAKMDLRSSEGDPTYLGRSISQLGIDRLHPDHQPTRGLFKYTRAYEALIPYVRRPGVEDDVSLLVPAEFHADTSPLVQLLKKQHGAVKLDAEAWDRIITWIDLNAPCHGTWSDFASIPEKSHDRRMALRRQFGGPDLDPEQVLLGRPYVTAAPKPAPTTRPSMPRIDGWPLKLSPGPTMTLDLGEGVLLKLVKVPAGRFVMGDADGSADETPRIERIDRAFWMGQFEVTNAQFRRFDEAHDPRYYGKRHLKQDDQGLPLNGPDQPAVRVSWEQATAFCEWMSRKTGRRITLPTQEQWEWACRAGSTEPFWFGGLDADFSAYANLADASFATGLLKDGRQITGGVEHLIVEGAALAHKRFNDRAVVTIDVGSYRPNALGLYDMHGNAAEWTRTAGESAGRRVVRGGSFFDPPARCRSAYRLSYPAWQRVFNVGFRVIMEE